jgi:hypothetical protein
MKSSATVKARSFYKLLCTIKITFVLIGLFSINAFADGSVQATVTGKVTDENGAALNGVSVQVKGTNKGTTTNSTGVYSIATSNTDVLVFSYVGYETQEIAVGRKTELNVTMAPAKSTSLEAGCSNWLRYSTKKGFNGIYCKSGW